MRVSAKGCSLPSGLCILMRGVASAGGFFLGIFRSCYGYPGRNLALKQSRKWAVRSFGFCDGFRIALIISRHHSLSRSPLPLKFGVGALGFKGLGFWIWLWIWGLRFTLGFKGLGFWILGLDLGFKVYLNPEAPTFSRTYIRKPS